MLSRLRKLLSYVAISEFFVICCRVFGGALPDLNPEMEVLQTSALPLG